MKAMKSTLTLILLAIIFLSACNKSPKSDNPFFNKYDTPFEVPPFDKIKTAHFMPAYLKGFEEENKEIDAIVNNSKEPTFENTIKEMQYTGDLLDKVSGALGILSGAGINDSIQALNKELSPLQSKHRDDRNLNEKLFLRVKKVYENKDKLKLTDEEKKLLDDTYKDFVRNGAALSPEDKEKLRAINKELSMLSVQFGENVLAETNGFKLVID
jgi:peptidyl-dipeptidase Dcp